MGQSFTIDLTDLKKFDSFLERVSYSYTKAKAIREELEDLAIDMRNFVIDGMTNTSKSSKGYKRGDRVHFPSRPGEMPARDSGELISRITYDSGFMNIEFGVEAGAPYAEWLEDGTDKMDARPFLQPTIDFYEPWIERRMWRKIREVTKGNYHL